ncbi:MAG: glycosyltransferase [Lentisphaerae bacterium]|nr:glycosyltransferase [Lentisphaerota bacterium]
MADRAAVGGGKALGRGDDLGQAGAPLLIEVAWEVCQQLGGIYTVIRSKIPAMVKRWGGRYLVVGPYDPAVSPGEFEECAPPEGLAAVLEDLQREGVEAHYGTWLVTGKPRTILLRPGSVQSRLAEAKYLIWEHHQIGLPGDDGLINQVVSFGVAVQQFLRSMVARLGSTRPLIAHFHEWMAGTALPEIRHERLPLATVFTTHATSLGRYEAMTDPWFYDHLAQVPWEADARRFNIEPQVRLERAAAQSADVLTTVSEITGMECEHLLGRRPDLILPNGLNLERFVAMHEFQILHRDYKARIGRFVMAHFFPSYSFDLDRTLYFFSAGRLEYRNKGFDLTIEALARLNARMKRERIDKTVVFFLITKAPQRSINPEVLRCRALLADMHDTCDAIRDQIGEALFVAAAKAELPQFEELVTETMRLRLRRMIHTWKTERLPFIVTHDLVDDVHDEVLNQIRRCQLFNRAEDPVKVVYHPDFVTPSNPLFGIDYDQFVRGCHLGIFPSAYEPWGYTPLECVARGIPAVTSDLSGFGSYLVRHMPDYQRRGLFVVHRRSNSYEASAEELANWLLDFTRLERRDRISLRNAVESSADHFDWSNLGEHYAKAHDLALEKAGR